MTERLGDRPGGRRASDAEARFDAELRSAARSLVSEELPRGVMSEPVSTALGQGGVVAGSVSGRRPWPGFAAAAAAVVVLVVASAVAFGPRLPGGPVPSPTASPAPSASVVFRTSTAIRTDFLVLRYGCLGGQTLAPTETGADVVVRESVVCTPPTTGGEPYMAAVIVGESAAGRVVEVHAKADLVGGDRPTSRAALTTLLAKAAAVVVLEGTGTAVATWVEANLPALDANESVATTIAGVHLEMGRSPTGSYTLRLTPVASGG